jgi:hypothetical protein
MIRSMYLAAILVVLAAGGSHAHGQEATERFIPIGQSPGQSGKTTLIGSIQSVDAQGRQLTISTAAGVSKISVTERTKIWIDRSASKQTNSLGSVADLQAGRRVEVKWDAKDKSRAEWIKVEAAP